MDSNSSRTDVIPLVSISSRNLEIPNLPKVDIGILVLDEILENLLWRMWSSLNGNWTCGVVSKCIVVIGSLGFGGLNGETKTN